MKAQGRQQRQGRSRANRRDKTSNHKGRKQGALLVRMEGKLTNAEGEFIASGPSEVNLDKAEVTMWPSWELHMLERERGELTLDLADGSRYRISDKHLTFKLAGPTEQRISVYRLRILPQVPEHLAAGYSEPMAGGMEQAAGAETPAPVKADAAREALHVVTRAEDGAR